MDLTRNDSEPLKVLEGFDGIRYNVDDDRIAVSYIDEGQGYLALYQKDTLLFRKRFEDYYNLTSIYSDENNEIIYIEGYGATKTVHTLSENDSNSIKFGNQIRFHYPFIFYEHEKNELWFQSIEEKNVIHRFVFINTITAIDNTDTVNCGYGYLNKPQLQIGLLLSYESDHKIAKLTINFKDINGKLVLEGEVERMGKSINFSELPNADILSFTNMRGVNEKGKEETCFLFHFSNQLKLYFMKSGKIKKTFDKKIQRRNIIQFRQRTFFWEDKGRSIERMDNIVPKNEKHYFYKAYDAKNMIKLCKKVEYAKNKECLLI